MFSIHCHSSGTNKGHGGDILKGTIDVAIDDPFISLFGHGVSVIDAGSMVAKGGTAAQILPYIYLQDMYCAINDRDALVQGEMSPRLKSAFMVENKDDYIQMLKNNYMDYYMTLHEADDKYPDLNQWLNMSDQEKADFVSLVLYIDPNMNKDSVAISALVMSR